MYGTDYRYAASRLEGTIVRNGKQPVMVLGMSGGGLVRCETIVTNRRREFQLEDLDLTSPPLGMVNTHRGAVYLARKPMRNDWRQGLRPNNITSLKGRCDIDSRLIYRCILGKYPRFKQAIDDCIDLGYSVAFHRHWSVQYDNTSDTVIVNYKWYGKAGVVDLDTLSVRLIDKPDYQFSNLEAALQEAMYDIN